MNKALVPQIRFKGFTYAWELKRLGDVVILNRYSQIGATELEAYRLRTGEITLLPSSKNYDWKTSKAKVPYGLVNDGEIITVGRARNANTKYAKGLFISSQNHIIESFNIKQLLTKFLFYIIKNNDHKFYTSETTYPIFTRMDFEQLPINHPKQIIEQQKIVSVFNIVDSLLTLHQRKCDALKKIKQTLLEKMFPVEGSNVPSIRFAGFTYAWELKRLGDLVTIDCGSLDANKAVKDGVYNFYTSGVDVFKINDFAFEGDSITIAGNGVNMGFLHLAEGKFNAYQRTYVLQNIKIVREFLYFSLWTNFWNECQKYAKLGAIPYIVYEQISDFQISSPQLPEQNKIAQTFSTLDSLLTLHQRKCEKLKKIKQELLNKMFV
ncbi:restriction endonuclease subunit S [Mycoplasmopsis opalescens]|uniref:restriction endonuclease subunit S n=1 Tax=Mycoplasmopsis opalescens TaxID=114886 RepID=UPI000ACE0FCD|nr:restriction endonuclease subunit S [Mycoplasmopsis opalescens]